MPEFSYSAYQAPADKVGGRLQAESEEEAAARLLERGLQPFEIKRVQVHPSWRRRMGFRARLNHRDRALFARQMSDLLKSGMPTLDALKLLEEQTDSPTLDVILPRLRAVIRDGGSLSDAMDALPRDFSRVHVSLVRAGEGTGLLNLVLNQLAVLEDREYEMRARVQSALLYPTITACVGLVTVLVILNFVIPRLSSIFEDMGQSLPFITRILLGLSHAAQWIWGNGIPLLLAAILIARLSRRWERWRVIKDGLLLRLPRLGRLIVTLQVARFSAILGSLLRNGVPMVPALGVTADTLDQRSIRQRLLLAVERVNQGERLGTALERDRVLPRVVAGMIAVGENTGNLEGTLERIGESNAREADRMIRILVGLIEPGLILLMGLFVAFIVAAVILPIFQVNLSL